MPFNMLKAIKVGMSATHGPYLETEIDPLKLFGSRTVGQGTFTLYLYTVDDIIPESKYVNFLENLKKHARNAGCQVKYLQSLGIEARCGSKAVLRSAGSTLAKEIGLDLDVLYDIDDTVEPEDVEELLNELDLYVPDPQGTYIYVELVLVAPLAELGWVRENIAWLLDSMDLLEAKYQAKIVIDREPRRYEVLEDYRHNGVVKIMYINDKTVIYLRGPHHLRDPKFYDKLRRAFTRRWLL